MLVNPPEGNRLRFFPSDNQQPGLRVSMRQKEDQAIDLTRVGPMRADGVSVFPQILSERGKDTREYSRNTVGNSALTCRIQEESH